MEGVAIKLKVDDIGLIIDLFANSIAPEKFVRQEIDCVSKLTQFCQRMTTASFKACQLFWDIACQVRPYPKEIIESSIDKLKELLMNQEREIKMEYLDKSFDSLTSH